ncbi:2',3'-cyclic-nucleotide 3'-phosphodiesterase-like isoform X2 [Paramacrobiotus metropolitanus]|uniref:2',3'-cyclic-nucleotide 3'-phosphodiesterase-like isoform X2 n=1 Tax=Paramacrobiotus metropolitanus TaxID=2943436 RepID=UPI00244636D4|nr:2',3'-cyclic-nucleotide 3'-phosphodiesterase-like isoform X2 [Paramacrobiotus metropolitanus]
MDRTTQNPRWSRPASSSREPSSSDFPSLPSHTAAVPAFLGPHHAIYPPDHPPAHYPEVHSYAQAAAHPPEAPPAPLAPLPPPPPDFLDFPFLKDPRTVEYLQQRGPRLMMILRGCPGSGKSLITGEVQRVLGEGVAVRVASADDFWRRNPAREYRFERERLPEAHEWCRMECERFCSVDHAQLVIVDNTNIEFREFQPYLRLAHRHGFATLLVEPQTPWRYDAGVLLKKNVHGVDRETIERRLKRLQERFVFPMYYGWFLTPSDSLELLALAVKLANSMLRVEEVRRYVEGQRGSLFARLTATPEEEQMEWPLRRDLYHVTACYTQYGKRPGVQTYATSDAVQKAMGKVFELEIVGLLITPQTVSFRVILDDEQLPLWNPEVDNKYAGLPVGSRAHITVQTADGVGAYVAGRDMMQLVEFVNNQTSETMSDVDAGLVVNYPADFWYLNLNQSVKMPALFAPFYCRDEESRRSTATPPSAGKGDGRTRRPPVESSSGSSEERSGGW